MSSEKNNDLQEIITQVIEKMKKEQGAAFDINRVNLAELVRLTGISRKKLRRIRDNGFIVPEHGNKGKKHENTVLTGYTAVLDDLLRKGVTNASVCMERIQEHGYSGGITQVRLYIGEHRDLVPPKRQIVSSQGNRGRRYTSEPGQSYQMDWGFVNVETDNGGSYQASCFALICHHCGERYVEFFPNAKQENLFIGMVHGFSRMGVPEHVLTDNMKSIVDKRDSDGHPIWNREYEAFMEAVGFKTKLCKPRHPFTKGAVERLVQFVKNNFMAGRVFSNITELNYQAVKWCDIQNGKYHTCVDCIPHEEHVKMCGEITTKLAMTEGIWKYLCPERIISFDGFVNYEGRRFGVPYWYTKRTCRIMRKDFTIYIYASDMSRKLTEHNVTWSRKASYCKDQYAQEQPEELPTMPVKVSMKQKDQTELQDAFSRFCFDKEVAWDE